MPSQAFGAAKRLRRWAIKRARPPQLGYQESVGVMCGWREWARSLLIANLHSAGEAKQLTDQTRCAENLKPTAILDWGEPEIKSVATDLREKYDDHRQLLQAAHGYLVRSLLPIYTLNELQPASVTVRKKCGSCSQRTACLEAIARAAGIPTRARALFVSGQFWYPRFRAFAWFLPEKVLLVWPQFFLDGTWTSVDEIYAPLAHLAQRASNEFRNDGESIFDAIDRTPIDFFGKTCTSGCVTSKFDLSKFVVSDEGIFATRDEVFTRFGVLRTTLRGRAFELLFGGRKSV
jgi:Transglutaminase-like superfamily